MKNKPLYRISRCGLFAAIICVCAFITIPIGTVPISMALLAVMLCGCVLSPVEAFCTSFVYIIMGAAGLPVFSGASGGIGILFGPTGGYIWSYPVLAFIISLFSTINTNNKVLKHLFLFIGCILGVLICYACGTVQYMLLTHSTFYTAAITCIFPFVLIDILKIIIVISIGVPLKKKMAI